MGKAKAGKLKDLIPLETRISLYQTSMNNSGRNFEGKKVPVKKMAGFSLELYKIAIKDIGDIGRLSESQMKRLVKKEPVVKKVSKNDLNKIMKKIRKKKNGKGKKKAKGKGKK